MQPRTHYDDIAGLPLSQLIALSRDGDAQERVWSAWALGVRAGQEYREALLSAFIDEHDEGVRRHLLIVLVGLGEQQTLRHATARASSPLVRATATALLARCSEPNDATNYDLIVGRSIDPAWHVRYAVADALRTDAPVAVVRAVAGLLFDPDAVVQARMHKRIGAGDFSPEPFAAALAVLRRANEARPSRVTTPSASTALVRLRAPLRLL